MQLKLVREKVIMGFNGKRTKRQSKVHRSQVEIKAHLRFKTENGFEMIIFYSFSTHIDLESLVVAEIIAFKGP